MNTENEIFEPVIESAPAEDTPRTSQTQSTTTNKIAFAIKGVAYFNAFCGFLGAFSFAQTPSYWGHTETNYRILLTVWLITAISTIFLLGFAEIIVLLQKLVDNSKNPNS